MVVFRVSIPLLGFFSAHRDLLDVPNSSGQARVTIFAANGNARTFDYQAGDVGYVPVSRYLRLGIILVMWRF